MVNANKQQIKLPKPDKPCYNCGTDNWWLRGNEYLCSLCHPNPNEKEQGNESKS